ncbi:NAD-dependent epimerase/dehydratase family protein [Trujillonella endophytica]|uniref:Nucleoside-diphosphate-sugar epimerase n=1 Tax=Trujillonella endophytica TaxID=673521 RepID=A0A1H8PUF2_9ACTN|nr:NAD-dependent epimerase/dehydratase family protein [Trujillella endophytica]SEO45297.1 Nucleoside-diphosphate-sugar epimerase [Trujillella endophytica]
MHVFLTGGTGLIGSAVLTALLADGATVSALARSDASAATLTAAGAAVVRGDLTDGRLLATAARGADAVVHTASPGDGTSAAVDAALLDAVLPALAGTGRPYVHTSGAWALGSGDLDETTPPDPAELVAWRVPLDARVQAAAADGVRSVVLAPGIVHRAGAGIPATVVGGGPRTPDGALVLPGSGAQHWTTVHADDLGRLYALALRHAAPGSRYLAVSGHNPTVTEIGAAFAPRVVGSSDEETAGRLGLFGAALLLDQRATGALARSELGWAPAGPTLLDELTRAAAPAA